MVEGKTSVTLAGQSLGPSLGIPEKGGQCPFSGPLHSHDIKFSDESWGQEAPMTLGLSKTHGIFFWKGHFNKAVCLWVTPRFLWGDRGLISMLDK